MIQIFGSLTANSTATRALVMVHGTNRNASDYYKYGLAAAKKAGVDKTTLVLAPWFKTKDDKPKIGEPVWTNDQWKEGGGKLSSFQVMDDLLALLADIKKFPALLHVVVAGHSAGGQYAQRYAAFGQPPTSTTFVVANPSSYCYFGPERPSTDGLHFTVPKTKCTSYDAYKYGLNKRSGYVSRLSGDQALTQYLQRRVTVLNGGADTTHDGDLDVSCAANLQGPHRRARGEYFHAHYPSPTHDRVVVPGVGHDAAKMFSSPLSWPALFGTGT